MVQPMTIYRFRKYEPEPLPIGTCFGIWAALDLVCVGLFVAVAYAAVGILKFIGWL
jgi:hypothetical protein